MAKTLNSFTNKKSIQQNIFAFYSKHASICNKAYKLAKDPKISEIYNSISGKVRINTFLAKSSIVILTANKYEKNILHKKIFELTNQKISRFKINLCTACEKFNEIYAYSFIWGKNNVLHIHANVTGSYTVGGSADIIRWLRTNKFLFPKLIISFGICFGTNPKKYNIGDVIISNKIYPYFIGVKIKGQEIVVVDDNAFIINESIRSYLNNLDDNNLLSNQNLGFNIEINNYLTGEAVINSEHAVKSINDITKQETPAGEMEGYGIFKECNCSDFKIPCFILKSICDWGAEKNFDISDNKTLNYFIDIWNSACLPNKKIKKITAENKLKTLKDQLQAYSAYCAFNALNILIGAIDKDISLYAQIVDYILNYNGAATNCGEIINAANNMAQNINITCKTCDLIVHRILMLLDGEIVQCDDSCITDKDEDKCYVNPDDTCITIKRYSKKNKKSEVDL